MEFKDYKKKHSNLNDIESIRMAFINKVRSGAIDTYFLTKPADSRLRLIVYEDGNYFLTDEDVFRGRDGFRDGDGQSLAIFSLLDLDFLEEQYGAEVDDDTIIELWLDANISD